MDKEEGDEEIIDLERIILRLPIYLCVEAAGYLAMVEVYRKERITATEARGEQIILYFRRYAKQRLQFA